MWKRAFGRQLFCKDGALMNGINDLAGKIRACPSLLYIWGGYEKVSAYKPGSRCSPHEEPDPLGP